MNLYSYHDKPESIHGHEKLETHVPDYVWDKFKYNEDELKKRETALAKSPDHSYWYARDFIGGPWKKGEPAIARSAELSYLYANYILKKPFPLGEDTIAKSSYAYDYATNVVKGRWEKGEPRIHQSLYSWQEYQKMLEKNKAQIKKK